MPAIAEFTFQELARIALGTPELTNFNITILHSLIDLLLKKLDCHNEKVQIGGFESKCLEKILEKSTISTIPFNDDHMVLLSNKLNKIAVLEERIGKLDKRLENHFEEIRKCQESTPIEVSLDRTDWERYGYCCEDLCTTCDPENEIACSLLKNEDFCRKLNRRIAEPMVRRIFILEDKIDKLCHEFNEFMIWIKQEMEKLVLLERCIGEIELLRERVDDNLELFFETMEEVQEMFDAKLDKIHIPALKKYIKEKFEILEKAIKQLQAAKSCPKAAGILMNVQCLSCGGKNRCANVGEQPAGLMRDAVIKKAPPYKTCGCQGVIYHSPKITTETFIKLAKRTSVPPEPSQFKQCTKDDEFIKGTDNKFYRKG